MGKNRSNKEFVFVITIVLLISAIAILPLREVVIEKSDQYDGKDSGVGLGEDSPSTPKKHGSRASSPRTVLAEFISNWGCPRCPPASLAINDLMDTYSPDQLVMISYRFNAPESNDPFYLYNKPDNKLRYFYYDVPSTGIPVTYFDGPPYLSRVDGDPPGTYTLYKNRIDLELINLSPLTISLSGNLDPGSMNGIINATIEVTDPLPAGDLKVRFVVVEDNLYALGPNGEARHRNVMRDVLNNESLPALTVGQTYDVSRTFPIDPALNMDSLSVVVFVQNDDDKDVLQAAQYDFIPQDILVVDDDQSVNPEGYEDSYHEVLCEMEYSFDGWILNDRGSPTSTDLSNYDAVIWVCGDTSSNTLTAADQTAISDYLDSGKGSVFFSGENIGTDIGSTSFYQDYMYANLITDDTGESQITGIQNDPISDPFFSTDIPITGSSPSRISPQGSATTVFQYSSSGDTGGIKAVHDINSKVVYFSFMYFEGSDSDSNKMILMERILNWMMDFPSTPWANVIGPTSSLTNDASPVISYDYGDTPTSVEIYYSDDGGSSWTLWGSDVTVDGLWSPGSALPASGTYYWNARAIGSTNESVPIGSGDIETGAYVLDIDAPSIVSTEPVDEAVGIGVGAGMYVIEFNEPMNTSLTPISDLPGISWGWDPSGIWLNGTYTDLSSNTTYYVDLSGPGFTDLAGNALTGDSYKNFTTIHGLKLNEGWNLISIPYIQSDTGLSAVLESIEGDYDAIQWYDSIDPSDPWKHYHISKFSEMNDFSDITHDISFWIHINRAGGTTMGYKGTAPTVSQNIDFHVGWNLVGYPSLMDRERDMALNNIIFGTDVDSIWTYDSTTQEWIELINPTDYFEVGQGYWIHSKVDKTWNIPL